MGVRLTPQRHGLSSGYRQRYVGTFQVVQQHVIRENGSLYHTVFSPHGNSMSTPKELSSANVVCDVIKK
jgi:hypothetical protein